jgi:hypothetical protein
LYRKAQQANRAQAVALFFNMNVEKRHANGGFCPENYRLAKVESGLHTN